MFFGDHKYILFQIWALYSIIWVGVCLYMVGIVNLYTVSVLDTKKSSTLNIFWCLFERCVWISSVSPIVNYIIRDNCSHCVKIDRYRWYVRGVHIVYTTPLGNQQKPHGSIKDHQLSTTLEKESYPLQCCLVFLVLVNLYVEVWPSESGRSSGQNLPIVDICCTIHLYGHSRERLWHSELPKINHNCKV